MTDLIRKYGVDEERKTMGFFNCLSLNDNIVNGVEIRNPDIAKLELVQTVALRNRFECKGPKKDSTRILVYPLEIKFFNQKSVDVLYFADDHQRDDFYNCLLDNIHEMLMSDEEEEEEV